MGRLSTCVLLAVAVLLTGCGTSGPVANRDADEFRRPDGDDKAAASASPPASPAARWMDDHTFAVCTGAVLLVLVGAAILTGLAFTSVFGHWH
jgi:predicted small lipoprotein YifL